MRLESLICGTFWRGVLTKTDLMVADSATTVSVLPYVQVS